MTSEHTNDQTDRGVSIAITHALTIAITAVLLSFLLIGAGNLLNSQEQRVAQEQFNQIGADISGQVDTMDRLNETGSNVKATAEPEYQQVIAGSTWDVEFTDKVLVQNAEYDYALNITTDTVDRTLQYPIQNETALDLDGSVDGSNIELCLENNEITLEGCS